jgi:hypothetical protein
LEIFGDFRVAGFIFEKCVSGLFELLMQRNGVKRDLKKSKEKRTGSFFVPQPSNFL